MLGLPSFAQAAMDDLAPAYYTGSPRGPCACMLKTSDLTAYPFWLEPVSVFGSLHLTMLAAVHLGWACHRV